LNPAKADPLEVINNAERQALGLQNAPRAAPEDNTATIW
jgi:hypothetical protein